MSYYIHIQSYKPIPGDKQAKTADGLFGTPYEAVMHTVCRPRSTANSDLSEKNSGWFVDIS